MNRKLLKKMIPKSVREIIKKEVSGSLLQQTEYIIRQSDLNKLSGKRIIVTGGTGAIGSAICHRLFLEGATVGICGRDLSKIDKLITRFENEKAPDAGILVPIQLDVLDDDATSAAIDQFVQETGGLDGFINNAGGSARQANKPIHNQTIETIDSVLNTNLRGCIMCARKAAQIMVEQNSGMIVNMSSVVGMQGKENMSDYAAAKAGIIGFTKSLAIELGKHNIRVNSVSPGIVNQTPFDAGMPEKITDKNVLGRKGYTDEVAGVVAFILSDDAKYITGHNFVVDGGRSLGLHGD